MIQDIPDGSDRDFPKNGQNPPISAEWAIDVTADICPMTFVRTRLALDRMPIGAILLVRLRGEEPRRNVPRTAVAQGHAVLGETTDAEGVTSLWLRRG
jgi:TusA-related sulfurtransferase